MLNGYRIAGVCITKLQDGFISDFLQKLHNEAVKEDYRLLVFNSFTDFSSGDDCEEGAKSVYQMVNFGILDILIIVDSCFFDKKIVQQLISRAEKEKIPVVVVYGEYPGCFSIKKNDTDTYKTLVSHIIDVHHAKKIYYIDQEEMIPKPDIVQRLECFRGVMSDYGLEIPDWGIICCEKRRYSINNAIKRWIDEKELPQAVVCANNRFAALTCECLDGYGIKVPEDVIVIGFGGQADLKFYKPELTTCAQDIPKIVGVCLKMMQDAVERNADPYTMEEHHSMILSESCGCHMERNYGYRQEADRLGRLLEDMRMHEEIIYSQIDHIHESTDLTVIGRNLSDNILPASAVALNSNFLAMARKNTEIDPDFPFTDKMVNISSRDENDILQEQEVFDLLEMYPKLAEHISENTMFVFQAIYVADEVCGYYMARMTDLAETVDKLHRLCCIINLDFGIIVNRIRQEHMTIKMGMLHLFDAHTGLLNMKGLIERINENYEEYSQYHIAVSIYAIQRYRYIFQKFGLETADEIVSRISEALQLANPNSSLIARISDDEFIIMNFIEESEMIGPTIDHATSTFFPIIDEYSRTRIKEFKIEVNCGCIVSEPGWENDMLSFIKAATGEMYLNRLIYGQPSIIEEGKTDEVDYHIFELLIEKNLFSYHFQPIVDARTGKIYAYEALMRTDEKINLKPDQILDAAIEYKRLYDIERATLFNVMEYLDTHFDDFSGRRVFINTIPGCFLKDDDYQQLVEKYGHLFGYCTIEIIEKNETTDAELMQIKCLECNGVSCQLAIDDYGTGFSNIVNLLRYQPQVIKLDRFLITDVHKDTNKQLFISNTVEFARLNDIQVLAEGVETKEELSKVISLGVDLIQGYYTARPSAEVLKEIDQKIAEDIVKAAASKVEKALQK